LDLRTVKLELTAFVEVLRSVKDCVDESVLPLLLIRAKDAATRACRFSVPEKVDSSEVSPFPPRSSATANWLEESAKSNTST
jgi:hypothetical protein